ncbi:MAG: D-2-hydroxyacid dehydrogenase [Lachnospiraceae bacterium]|nr:D-2-hydroxyacid dehydrogenase [Lachnospiraceae bacterium]
MKIVVLEADSVGRDVSYDAMKRFGEVVCYDSTPNDKILERIQDADIVIPNKCLITGQILVQAPKVKLIAESATGYNNIDVDYCHANGIAVTNVSGYSTDAVAQHTFALLLSLNNHMAYYSDYVNSAAYSQQASFTNVSNIFLDLAGKTMGIIGLGAIGKKVAEIATAFGMKVIYHSVSGHAQDVSYACVSFEEILKKSDVLSIHTPLTEKTRGLINKAALKQMKNTAVLINVARGPIVVEKDLVEALNEGQIAAAGLDVFETEPLPETSPLLGIQDKDKLLLTPHIAWGSYEARSNLIQEGVLNIQSFLDGGDRNRV